MAPRSVSLIAIGVFLLFANHVTGVKKVTVNAGMRYFGTFVLLITDGEVLLLRNNKEKHAGRQDVFDIPEDFHIMATTMTSDNTHVFFYGSDFYYDVNVTDPEDLFTKTVNYTRRAQNKFLKKEGPDAAFWINGKEYFIKGCKMAQSRRWARKKNIRKFGLPCNPDAAWANEARNETTILKGDQIWIWDGENKADGPMNFSSVYNITSWELIPSSSREE